MPTHHYIEVNGIKLHYVEEGSGLPVVLLHGFPEFWYSWRKQIPVIGQHYRIIAPDMRGYNLSDKPAGIENYKLDVLAKDIAELIRQLCNGKAILVGHDWGGAVAWAVATFYPELISKLALINIPHPEEMRKALYGFNLRQLLRSYYIFLFQLPALPERRIGRNPAKLFKRTFAGFSPKGMPPPDDEIQEYVKAYEQPGALTGTINYYRAALRHPVRLNNAAPLPMPVLMLWGEQDKALGKELTLNTRQYCSNLKVIYDPSCGHFLQYDNPELVNSELMKFFEKGNG